MSDTIENSGGVPTQEKKTPADELKALQTRAAKGEDVSDEASSLVFQLMSWQSQRIELGVTLPDEDYVSEVQLRNELEKLIYVV